MTYFSDFLSLIFPRICAGCGNSLWKNEEVICHFCEYHLPKTNYHEALENPVTLLLRGRVSIEAGVAFLHFNKGGKVQRLVHHLKYKGRKDVGICLGNLYGQSLKNAPGFKTADAIIPVPLHRKRQQQRGFNQSEQFAIGLSGAMQIPVCPQLLSRVKATETQTRKSRFSRYGNVREIFEVTDPLSWKGKHLVLVDDVITTGATLESCIQALTGIPGVRVSVACIAAAMI